MTKETPEILLARIDERQKQMSDDIKEIKEASNSFVKNDDDFKDFKTKIKTLWDERNKLVGWMIGTGIVGGLTGSIVKNLVTTVFAK